MSVERICNRKVVIASRGETVREGARRMEARNVGSLIVLDRDERPAGILTDRDIALRCVAADLDADDTTIGDIMTSPVETVPADTPVEEALRMMNAAAARRLPVVDGEGRLIGILALDDVLELLVDETASIGQLLSRHEPATP